MSGRAVLFDIDGTLLRAGGAGRRGLINAAARHFDLPQQVAAAAIEAIDFRGATDALIIEEMEWRLDRMLGGAHGEFIALYLEELDRALQGSVIEALVGGAELIAALEQAGVTVGLLTGNIREAARRKLAHINLAHLTERPGGFGEDGRERAELARTALQRLAAVPVPPERTLVIGDTPHDAWAAHAAGAQAVLVATGWTPLPELEQAGALAVLEDLQDSTLLWDLLERT